jgi:hypothetical protein
MPLEEEMIEILMLTLLQEMMENVVEIYPGGYTQELLQKLLIILLLQVLKLKLIVVGILI